MSPTAAGFQELATSYVDLQLRGDRREALQLYRHEMAIARKAGVGGGTTQAGIT